MIVKKETKTQLLNFIFLAVVFALTVWSVFHGADLQGLLECLQTIDIAFLVPSILCVILFIIGESVIIHYLFRTLGIQSQFSHCCLYSFIGFFYSCITPSASGGQPMQLIAMRKDRLPTAPCLVVLAIVAITYKMVLVVIGTLVLLIRPASVMVYLESVEWIMYLGLTLNVVCIGLLMLVVFQPNVARRLAVGCLALVNRIRPLRRLEQWQQRLDRAIGQYNGTAEFYRCHKRIVGNVLLITLAQRVILFLVTWLTYLAFDLSGHSMFSVVTLQGMIAVAVDMLPLPGGMGISENLFLDIFTPIFTEELVLPAMVFSRGISFYTQLLISAVMTVAAAFIIKDRHKENTGNG